MSDQQERYEEWAAKQEAWGKRIIPEDERAPIPQIYGITNPAMLPPVEPNDDEEDTTP